MSVWNVVIDGAKGAVTGAIAGFEIGGPWGALAGGIIGAGLGTAEGIYTENEKEKMVENQEQAANAQDLANQSAARRAAAAMHEQAAADPRGTSATILRKTQLQREANTNYADVRDKGNPFNVTDEKASKRIQYYGKVDVSKAA